MKKLYNREDLGIWLTRCQPQILLRQCWMLMSTPIKTVY